MTFSKKFEKVEDSDNDGDSLLELRYQWCN